MSALDSWEHREIADDLLAGIERRHEEGNLALDATATVLLAIGHAILGLYDDTDDPDTGEEAPKPLRAVS